MVTHSSVVEHDVQATVRTPTTSSSYNRNRMTNHKDTSLRERSESEKEKGGKGEHVAKSHLDWEEKKTAGKGWNTEKNRGRETEMRVLHAPIGRDELILPANSCSSLRLGLMHM